MKRKLLVIVTTLVCLLCPAWEEAAAEIGCRFILVVNGQPAVWGMNFGDFYEYNGVVGATAIGYDFSWSSGLHGSAVLPNGSFPVLITGTVGPSPNPIYFYARQFYMEVAANGQVTGKVLDIGLNGINSANITGSTNFANCTSANYVFG